MDDYGTKYRRRVIREINRAEAWASFKRKVKSYFAQPTVVTVIEVVLGVAVVYVSTVIVFSLWSAR